VKLFGADSFHTLLPAAAAEVVVIAAREFASLRARVVRGPATVLAESGVVLHLGAVKELYR
jgi:hypothetical protein